MSATAVEESKRNNRQFLPAQLYNLWYGLHTEILKSASGFRLFVVLNALCNNSSLLYNNSRHKTKEMFTGAFARSQVDLISDQIHLRSFLICLDIHFFTDDLYALHSYCLQQSPVLLTSLTVWNLVL